MRESLTLLARAMKSNGLDLMIIPPSGDMNFLIGFNPGGCERFQAIFVTAEARIFCVTNKIYREDMAAALPHGTPVYAWDDAGSFRDALAPALADHDISAGTAGITDAVRGVDLMALQAMLPKVNFTDACDVVSGCRIIKTPAQVELMAKAGRHADAAVAAARDFIRPGVTEREIKNTILDYFGEAGLAPSFTPIVASGANTSRPHYNRDDRVVTEKDVVLLDLGCMVEGFCSDTSRTLFVGEPTDREKELYAIVTRAFDAAAATAARGVTAGEVDQSARQVIENAGFGDYFLNRTGHGIGMDVHEAPYIRGGSRLVLEPGMAFSIEPGIYLPGEVGMRIEDIFVIDERGNARSLNHFEKGIVVLDPDR